MRSDPQLRVSLVHEWLINWGGSESVLLALCRMFPQAPIFTAYNAPDERTQAAFSGKDIRSSALGVLPLAGRTYRLSLPLMPWAFRRMDLGPVDLVVSSSHAFAKAVSVPQGALHLCYCHTPPRYLWDLYEEYNRGIAGRLRGPVLRRLRKVDSAAARGVHAFVANSHFVAERIRTTYGREARVVYPPVDVDLFQPRVRERTHFLAGGRMVRYKRLDVAIGAANKAGAPLVVFGDGPDRARLEALAGPTVRFVGRVSGEELQELIGASWALLFPGIEDFGILPVEVQAAGRPVIAFGQGGACETVLHNETGVLYEDPSEEGLAREIRSFEPSAFDPPRCRANAMRFAPAMFESGIRDSLEAAFAAHVKR
ncbi:MAG: glycosyltransferase [Longimicrobiales bacterium]|nr:glycosyltransferase [Longimicrobiales bacterium]